MSRRLLSLVAAVIFVAGGIAPAHAVSTIAIDGVPAGAIVSWEGGDLRASVVPGPTGSDGTATKQPGTAVCAPLVVQLAFPPADPLRILLGELCSNKASRKKLFITDRDAAGNATGATEFDGALLSEVRLPALDAASTTLATATFVFTVEQSREIAPPAAPAASSTRAASSSFRLVVDGLDTTGVARIESISISGGVSTSTVGSARDYTATPVAAGFSNLAVSITRAKSGTWRAWFDDFVVNGKSSDGNEKSGALEFLTRDTKQVVFALSFQDMGILRVSRVHVPEGAPELVQAELYFEKLSTDTASISGDSDLFTQEGTDGTQQDKSGLGGNEETTTDEISGVREKSPAMLSETSTADASGTTNVSVSDRFTSGDATVSDSTSSPTRAGTVVGTTSTGVTNTNPADQGSRDPAGFPRVAGLTRIDFSGQYHETSTLEEAHYTTQDKIYDLLARVDTAAKAEGWTLVHFAEGYSQGERWVTEQWKKNNSGLALSINQPDTGITRYWIRVTTQIPGAN